MEYRIDKIVFNDDSYEKRFWYFERLVYLISQSIGMFSLWIEYAN